MQHAAESRWQPGRSGRWGSWRGGGGEERVAYVGGVCARAWVGGGITQSLLSQHPNIVLVKKNKM